MKYTLISLILSAFAALSVEIRPIPDGTSAFQTEKQLIINEILFNPKKDGVDFVEIFNSSSRAINLQEVLIANINNAGQVANMQRISESAHIMMPGTYRVLTIDPQIVAQHYPKARLQNFIRMNRLPALNNDQGRVLLLHQPDFALGGRDTYVLDSLSYSASMHSAFIKDAKGVSLERLSSQTDTNEPGNFRSAAVAEGGATPGYQNSSSHDLQTSFQLLSRIISPDQDGIDDQLVLHYNIGQTGLMATIQIFNSKGFLVKNMLRNSSIPSQGSWLWEGVDERGSTVHPGIYTIVIELYNDMGYHQLLRKSFVVAFRN